MLRSLFILAVTLGMCLCSSVLWARESVQTLEVVGNHRVETPTILSYITIKPGEVASDEKVEEILKNLFSTGLFSDVVIEQQGTRLIIRVVENKIINRIAFEGNSRLKDEVLESELGIKPREVYTPARVQDAAQKIRDMYRLSGRYGAKVEPKIIEREQSRVDLIFEITEGKLTRINRIIFIGNNRYSTGRLESVIMTKESRWYRFFTTDDTYDPDRLAYDKELLRRFYQEQGYADFKVESVVAELDPDEQEFYITYTLFEGERYRFGDIKMTVNLPKLSPKLFQKEILCEKGEWFNSKEVEKTVEKLVHAIGEKGFAFVEIEPQFERHPKTRTVDINFIVKEGRHVYINRIDVVGNDRTDDEVIRREFRLVEGDAYNSERVKRTEQRLQNLDYFKKVDIKQEETAVPDKVDLKVEVEDKPTGSLQFSGGFSSVDGPIGTITMNERNLMGKGYDLYASGMVAKRAKDYHLGLTDPYFLGRPLSAGIDLFYGFRKFYTKPTGFSGYTQGKTGASLTVGYELHERLGQSWNYMFRGDYLGDMNPRYTSPFVFAQQGKWILSTFGHSLFLDKRDNSVTPTTGYFASLADEYAGIGGTVGYFKNSLRLGKYMSIDEEHKWVLSVKGSVGIMVGTINPTRVVDRFELGADSLRGFADGGVGPRDMRTGDALGGLYYYKVSTELSFPIGLPNELGVKGSGFADVGAVWHPGNTSPFISGDNPTPRVGIGAGITWKSPFGPIGAYYAPYVVGEKNVDRITRFNVTFGSSF